ncbi:MAG: energy-coupling factor transporter transmembrane protein EcfT, partial [Clostridiales Family XIII bacterium]|nr:energy-coupling factor transporter transmembrane protein EcfT [Clostridiales Family XIII bacterium]
MKNFFAHYHPAVVFLYICCAIISAMITLLPVYVAVSAAIGSAYAVYLSGARKYLSGLRLLAIFFFIIVIVTPLTNHRGATALFDLPFGLGPVTLEAVIYGVCTGGMLVSVFIWFQCYQRLITNDKFMFLFGRIAPTSAMIISMIIKFIPVTGQKLRSITEARKALGTGKGTGTDTGTGTGTDGRQKKI